MQLPPALAAAIIEDLPPSEKRVTAPPRQPPPVPPPPPTSQVSDNSVGSSIVSSRILGSFSFHEVYRVIQVLRDLGWVDLDSDVPPSCVTAQPPQPNSHQPKKNWADSGTIEKIKF